MWIFYFLFSPPLVTEIAEQKNMNLNLCLACLMLPVFPKSHSSELPSVVVTSLRTLGVSVSWFRNNRKSRIKWIFPYFPGFLSNPAELLRGVDSVIYMQ
jgi:hypothetical protein